MTNDDFSGLTNGGTTGDSFTIGDVLDAVRELDKLGRGPVAVKLNPRDIEQMQHALASRATYGTVTTDHALPPNAVMRIAGMPIYPDATVTEGKPRWAYADEVPHG